MSQPSEPTVVHLDQLDLTGPSGAIWSLPHGGDLDANLVKLAAGAEMPAHANPEVDVLVLVMSGDGALTVDGDTHQLSTGACALVPKGSTRSLAAGPHGLAYLTVHRSRTGLGVTAKPLRA